MGYIAELQQIDTAEEPAAPHPAPRRGPAPTPWLGASPPQAPVDWPAQAAAGHWSHGAAGDHPFAGRVSPPGPWSAPAQGHPPAEDPEPTDVYAALGTLAAGPVDGGVDTATVAFAGPGADPRGGPARHAAPGGGHTIDITPGGAPPAARSPRRRRRLAVLAGAAAAVLAGGVGYAVLRPSGEPDLQVAPAVSAPAPLFGGDAAPGAEAVPGADPVATASVIAPTSTRPAAQSTTRADPPPATGTAPAADPVTGRPSPASPSAPSRPAPAPSPATPSAEAARLTATLSGAGEPDDDGLAGYRGTVRVANSGPGPAGTWRVSLTVPGGNQVRADPTVTVSQNGEAVTFTPADGTVAAGAAVSFTFTVDGVLPAAPHGCLLDDAPCA